MLVGHFIILTLIILSDIFASGHTILLYLLQERSA